MRKSDVLNSPRLQELKKNRRKSFQNRVIFYVVAIVIIFLGFGFLSRISKLNIEKIVVSGNIVVDSEDIEKIVNEDMAGHYVWLIPKTSIFFYPKKKITNDIAGNFQRLKDIKLNLTRIETLEISVAEREGVYIWCGLDFPETSKEEQCLFIDKDGYTFDEAPYFSGEVYFKFYGSIFETYNPMFPKLIGFKENLEQMGLKPVALIVKEEDTKILLSSSGGTSKNPEIIFKLDADLEKSAENLQAALDTEPLRTDIKNKYSLLEYIDLRYGNKVYYRFR